jgi:hypothetical protein
MAYEPFHESIQSFEDFERVLRVRCGGSVSGSVIFRGVRDASYDLLPSFARALDFDPFNNLAVTYRKEYEAFNHFRREARHFLDERLYNELRDVNNPLQWLTVMQHYGGPTRLLDWTKSPYIALYFACESEPKADGAVWVWQRELTKAWQEEKDKAPDQGTFKDFLTAVSGIDSKITENLLFNSDRRSEQDSVCAVETQVTTERLTAQSGVFSIADKPEIDHREAIESVLDGNPYPDAFGRIDIVSEAKVKIMAQLRRMSITGFTMFPDIEGLSRVCREKVQYTDIPYEMARPGDKT